jgi:ATP-dependent exoDNAse (exonuclease V) beta subunit
VSPVRDRFPHVVIRASAGTGKTFQLSNRFLDLAAAGEPLDSILATTFTRKAAGEILDRVLTRLAQAALDPQKLADLGKHVGDGAIQPPQCQQLLRDMVRHLHRLRVGTLDSFFIQVARSFSLELGLPPGWQIIDEVADQRLRAEAVRAVLREEATTEVVSLMNLLTKGEATRSVSEQIASLVNELYGFFVEAPAEAWQALVRHKELPDKELHAALLALEQAPIAKGNRCATAREQDLANARAGDWLAFLTKGLGTKVFDGTETFYSKPIPDDLVTAYRPLVTHAKAVLVGRIANQTDATHRLLKRFDEAYQRLKTTQRALRFEDVTRKLGERWVAQRLQEVVFRLDARLSHLLLDEFQDTSPLQWRVLRPFAQSVIEGSGQRSFFCVGDVKQAIYGWRGGVAEIFEALGDDLPQLQPDSLTKSYRSCPAVIDTVNRVFQGLTGNKVLERYATAASKWAARFEPHSTARMDLAGHCRLLTAPPAPEGQEQGVETLRFAARQVAELYRQAAGHTIGVLVRRNAAVARLIFELRQQGIEASEEGGNPLTDSPAVQLVLSLLTLADHPGDTVARFHVANSPLGTAVGLSRFDDTAAAWRLSNQIRDSLMTQGYGPTVYAWVKRLAGSCDRRDLNRLMQLVEKAYGYQASATTRADDFVTLICQQRVEDPTSAPVRVMTVHQSKGLQFDIVVLPELDVGLTGQPPQLVIGRPKPTAPVEYVCRYVAKNLRPLLPQKFSAMFESHECQVVEESLCVLYVALTRAVHGLHMIIAPAKPQEKTVPSTAAGLLRRALADGQQAEPESVLYELGRAGWMTAEAKPPAPPPRPLPDSEGTRPLDLCVAPSPQQAFRGLDRQMPSQMEGGNLVSLSQALCLDSREALDRGTLIHAWFEAIEWLDCEQPSRSKLQELGRSAILTGLDLSRLLDQFEQALRQPALSTLLSRATYEKPAGPQADSAVHRRPGMTHPRWKVWRERPFALREGDAILSGQIDRLVVLYEGEQAVAADLIDYKTDRVSVEDPAVFAARVEHYRPQLEAYRRAVARLLGVNEAQVSARLAFVAAGVVCPI